MATLDAEALREMEAARARKDKVNRNLQSQLDDAAGGQNEHVFAVRWIQNNF